MVVHTFNLHVQDSEAGRSLRTGGGACLHGEFQVAQGLCSAGFILRPCHIKKKGGLMEIYILEYQFFNKIIYPIHEILCICKIFTRKEHEMYKINS